MTGRVVWRCTAEQHVVEAAVYIADDSPSAAMRRVRAPDNPVDRSRRGAPPRPCQALPEVPKAWTQDAREEYLAKVRALVGR
jgi:hypothetical protein